MWMLRTYNNIGIVIFDEETLNDLGGEYFEITEEPDYSKGVIKTDGKTWWYEDFPAPEPLTAEERITQLEQENESISEVLDALLMGEVEV
jgi:hypothetical protein